VLTATPLCWSAQPDRTNVILVKWPLQLLKGAENALSQGKKWPQPNKFGREQLVNI
jgi:hypothetical protein